ncbi:hypothetical protein ACIRH0_04015 [Streptomyces sp. NPDC093675]|uniref:hypothetical protein n=1 Tax=Streptomyces sp. NPDC093675 TaxID=3366049 RepID=UPI0038176BC7
MVVDAFTPDQRKIRADRSKGRWPAPDDTSNRAHRWLGAAVSKAFEGRRGYRKDGN